MSLYMHPDKDGMQTYVLLEKNLRVFLVFIFFS